jgi:hypothetical protein
MILYPPPPLPPIQDTFGEPPLLTFQDYTTEPAAIGKAIVFIKNHENGKMRKSIFVCSSFTCFLLFGCFYNSSCIILAHGLKFNFFFIKFKRKTS